MTRVTLPLALTIGEPAGVGGEITLKAWLARDRENLPPFFATSKGRSLPRSHRIIQ